ncbi:MAG: aminoglycoside phosphotransferase family protein, partial [Pseudomonadota bacterium]
DAMEKFRDVHAVVAAYGITALSIEVVPSGLINRTFRIIAEGGERYILQCLNPMFPGSVNRNIQTVADKMKAAGLPSISIIPAPSGELAVKVNSRNWRLMDDLGGEAFDVMPDVDHAAAASVALADFHMALSDSGTDLRALRDPVHVFYRHFEALRLALSNHQDHENFGAVKTYYEFIAAQRCWKSETFDIQQPVHGDPKVSNVLFKKNAPEVVALIDLDTVGVASLAGEIGDAFRSWSASGLEDDPTAHFRADIFIAAWDAYQQKTKLDQTMEQVLDATATIYLELAGRFACDALRERYFGWDSSRFHSAGAHNLARCAGQLSVYRSLLTQRAEILER